MEETGLVLSLLSHADTLDNDGGDWARAVTDVTDVTAVTAVTC